LHLDDIATERRVNHMQISAAIPMCCQTCRPQYWLCVCMCHPAVWPNY